MVESKDGHFRRHHKFFGKEGAVKGLGRNPNIRMVKLDGIDGAHVLTLKELKENI